MNEETKITETPEWKKLEQMAAGRYASLKEVAELISACPHVVPADIGIPQYIEELRKGAMHLKEFLVQPDDIELVFGKQYPGVREAPDQG